MGEYHPSSLRFERRYSFQRRMSITLSVLPYKHKDLLPRKKPALSPQYILDLLILKLRRRIAFSVPYYRVSEFSHVCEGCATTTKSCYRRSLVQSVSLAKGTTQIPTRRRRMKCLSFSAEWLLTRRVKIVNLYLPVEPEGVWVWIL